MIIHKMPLGSYQTNTYIVKAREDGTECVVIDPGYEADTILDYLNAQGLTARAILLTHGHFDHVGAVKELAAETGCQVYIHPAEATLPPMMTAGPLYYTHTYSEGDTIRPIDGMELTVLHTPGHTPGSVCLLYGQHLFSGDTLFQGSCGRVDFPGGSPCRCSPAWTGWPHCRRITGSTPATANPPRWNGKSSAIPICNNPP